MKNNKIIAAKKVVVLDKKQKIIKKIAKIIQKIAKKITQKWNKLPWIMKGIQMQKTKVISG